MRGDFLKSLLPSKILTYPNLKTRFFGLALIFLLLFSAATCFKPGETQKQKASTSLKEIYAQPLIMEYPSIDGIIKKDEWDKCEPLKFEANVYERVGLTGFIEDGVINGEIRVAYDPLITKLYLLILIENISKHEGLGSLWITIDTNGNEKEDEGDIWFVISPETLYQTEWLPINVHEEENLFFGNQWLYAIGLTKKFNKEYYVIEIMLTSTDLVHLKSRGEMGIYFEYYSKAVTGGDWPKPKYFARWPDQNWLTMKLEKGVTIYWVNTYPIIIKDEMISLKLNISIPIILSYSSTVESMTQTTFMARVTDGNMTILANISGTENVLNSNLPIGSTEIYSYYVGLGMRLRISVNSRVLINLKVVNGTVNVKNLQFNADERKHFTVAVKNDNVMVSINPTLNIDIKIGIYGYADEYLPLYEADAMNCTLQQINVKIEVEKPTEEQQSSSQQEQLPSPTTNIRSKAYMFLGFIALSIIAIAIKQAGKRK